MIITGSIQIHSQFFAKEISHLWPIIKAVARCIQARPFLKCVVDVYLVLSIMLIFSETQFA
jgi:hypothetical protein